MGALCTHLWVFKPFFLWPSAGPSAFELEGEGLARMKKMERFLTKALHLCTAGNFLFNRLLDMLIIRVLFFKEKRVSALV